MKTIETFKALLVVTSLWMTAAAQADLPKALTTKLVEVDGKMIEVLATADKKLSVYKFDDDSANSSTCYEQCAKNWPAILLVGEKAEDIKAPFVVSTRKLQPGQTEGDVQLGLGKSPLYRFAPDQKPEDTKGKNLPGWHLVPFSAAQGK